MKGCSTGIGVKTICCKTTNVSCSIIPHFGDTFFFKFSTFYLSLERTPVPHVAVHSDHPDQASHFPTRHTSLAHSVVLWEGPWHPPRPGIPFRQIRRLQEKSYQFHAKFVTLNVVIKFIIIGMLLPTTFLTLNKNLLAFS